jgi:3-deoxy-manno-octulosonate cytidylyltransferase (CMP-KDO synthetase)
MKVAIAIPARYNSTRLPGKPLIKLGSKPLIRHCYDCVKEAGFDTFVLTDDIRIASVIGEDSRIVKGELMNGTERLAVAEKNNLFEGYTHVINVQGDQPFVDISWIYDTIELLKKGWEVAHLYTDLLKGDTTDSSVVKMIHDGNKVTWMSRDFKYGSRVVSIYGFSRNFLSQYDNLIIPEEEYIEKVEQLRWLKNGFDIAIKKVSVPEGFVDINLEKDVERWKKFNVYD